ncbi:MAG: hypothetical protein O2968_21990, partial [Acidobacteria bacterium]|nr:hypothetical protein [Acidobacteriota bacterium]
FAPPVNGLESPLCGLFSLRRLHDKKDVAIHSIVGRGYVLQSDAKSSYRSLMSPLAEDDRKTSEAHT